MADEVKNKGNDIDITILDDVMTCSIPLRNVDGDMSKAKIIAYGALKVAEEKISIYYMHVAMRRAEMMKGSGIIKPGLA